MKNSLGHHWSYVLMLLICHGVSGQSGEELPYYFPHKIYTTKDGLSKTVINGILQDSRGLLWIGTDEGINRFDGLNFENHLNNEMFPEDRIYGIRESTSGDIWFSGFNGIYQWKGDTIINYLADNYKGIHPSYFSINSDNTVLFTDWNNRTEIYQILGKEVNKFEYIVRDSETAPVFLSDITHVDDSTIIIQDSSTKTPFWLLNFEKKELTPLKPESGTSWKSSSIFIDNGNTYLRFENEIYVFDNGMLCLIKEFEYSVTAFAVEEDRILFSNGSKFQLLADGEMYDFGIHFTFIRHILPTNNGGYWLATDDGLIKIYTRALQTFSQERGVFNKVFSVVEDHENNIWFAAYGNGLQRLKNGKDLEVIKGYEELLEGKSNFFYPGALATPDKNILFPTYGNIIQYDIQNGFSELPNTTIGNAIQEIEYYDDTLFLASKGFGVLSQNDSLLFYSDEEGLAMKDLLYLEAIERDTGYTWWLGSHNGLAKFEKGKFTNYLKNEEIGEGINSIHSDFKGNLWFGSHNGLLIYDYTEQLPKQVYRDAIQGSIQSINNIDSNYLLLGMTNKLILVDLQSFYKGQSSYYEIDEENGFQGAECSPNCNFLDSNGNVWIGTESNVIKLIPSELELRNRPQKVHFKSISHKDFQEAKFKVIPLSNNEVERLRFSPRDNLKIDFYIIDHSNPNKTSFDYQLKGKHLTWLHTDQRYISFSNLPLGRYELQVRSALSGNLSKPSILRFEIIADHVYEESWFMPLIVLSLIV